MITDTTWTTHSLAILCVAMAAVTAYLGLYHLILYLHLRQGRENLAFSLFGIATAAYNIACAGLYFSTSLPEGVRWQRLQLVFVSLISVFLIWFVGIVTNRTRSRLLRGAMAWFLLSLPLALVSQPGITPSRLTPAIKRIELGTWLHVTYFESDVGAGCTAVIVSALLIYCALLFFLFRNVRRGSHVPIIAASLTVYFVGVINDSMVGMRVYQFIYVSEYAFLFMVLCMAYLLLRRQIDLHTATEELNRELERRVEERTQGIEQANQSLSESLRRQRDMQEQLVQTGKMAGIGQLAAGVAHEINNPLAVILGFAESPRSGLH